MLLTTFPDEKNNQCSVQSLYTDSLSLWSPGSLSLTVSGHLCHFSHSPCPFYLSDWSFAQSFCVFICMSARCISSPSSNLKNSRDRPLLKVY